MRLSIFLFLCIPFWAQAQLTIKVNAVPSNTPAADDIYIAGSMNNWSPNDANSVLQMAGNVRFVTLNIGASNIQFKFTRGDWDSVEGNASGAFLPDRTYNYLGGIDTLDVTILSWEDQAASNSTATANVQIYDTDFYMPQLNKYRRIWVYLPPDYNSTEKDYPVLYMHDGQNVFDASTSFSGEWEVDETLNALHASGDYGCIVVAIDNGGADRTDEYSPWVNTFYNAGGAGADYVDFIVETLKPNIDATFRTRPERDFTGIMGSSLGGLISHYAGIKYPNVFSKIGNFSPAYWFNSEIFNFTEDNPKTEDMRFYLLVGGNEEPTDNVVTQTSDMNTTLGEIGFGTAERSYQYRAYGTHSESFWRNEFEDGYLWLFANAFVGANDQNKQLGQVFPNPADSFSQITLPLSQGVLTVFAANGQQVWNQKLSSDSLLLPTSLWSDGAYTLRIANAAGEIVWSTALLVKH